MAFDAEAERRRLAERYARGVCEKRMLNDTRYDSEQKPMVNT
jgi:hypothetical protein